MVKNPPASPGDVGSPPGSGRSPGGGNGNPLQYSILGNPIDKGAWKATVHWVAKSWTQLRTKQQQLPPCPLTVWSVGQQCQLLLGAC